MPNLNPYTPRKTKVHHYKWDEEYISYEVKDIVKKTGEGEDDFVLTQKIIEHREPIAEVVGRDAGTTGIKAVMERALRTGDPSILPPPLSASGVTNDYTNVPDNLLDAENYAKEMESRFNALPEEIRKGRTFEQFCQFFGQEEFDNWIKSMTPKQEEKKEGDK